jgi:DNA-binding HxlR family transcriptional regulator
MEILAFALDDGETMNKLQRAMDPEVAYQRELNERLERLEDEAVRIRREKKKRRKKCPQAK